jgi:hypothetical protein
MSIDISKLLDASFMLQHCPEEVPHAQRLHAERFIEANAGPCLAAACESGAEDFASDGRYYTAAILIREHHRLEQ